MKVIFKNFNSILYEFVPKLQVLIFKFIVMLSKVSYDVRIAAFSICPLLSIFLDIFENPSNEIFAWLSAVEKFPEFSLVDSCQKFFNFINVIKSSHETLLLFILGEHFVVPILYGRTFNIFVIYIRVYPSFFIEILSLQIIGNMDVNV